MTTESEPSIEPAPEPAPRITPAPESGERLPQMIERTRRRGRRRRAPIFTPQEVATIDYKDVDRLKKLISDRGRIEPRRKTGLTAKDQRKVAREIKRARQVALLPYTAEHMRQTSRFRMVTRMAQRAMRAELDDAPPEAPAEGGAEVDAPPVESAPQAEAPPQAEAAPQVEAAPPLEAEPQAEAGPSVEAAPDVEAAPQAEVVPDGDVAVQDDAAPTEEAASVGEAVPASEESDA